MKTIDDYIDEALKEEKVNFSSRFETFEAHAEKFRTQVKKKISDYKDSFLHGYELLAPTSTNNEAIEKINSFEKVVIFLAQGKLLYHIFGYSLDTLLQLYQQAHYIVEEKRYNDGYDAYLFLVTVAPHIREAWLNLGFVMCKLGDQISGIEAFDNARDLDPTKVDSYLAAAGAFLQLKDKNSALKVCELGPAEVKLELEDARKYIQGWNI